MIYTESMQEKIEDTTTSEVAQITVPDDVVDAIASRLDVLENPDELAARDLTHDHVTVSYEFVTEDGEPVEREALSRADATLECDATAELDYGADPERPLSIGLTIPSGAIDEDDLDDVLAAVSIDAQIGE